MKKIFKLFLGVSIILLAVMTLSACSDDDSDSSDNKGNQTMQNFANNFPQNEGMDVISSMTYDEEGQFTTVTLNDDEAEGLDQSGELKSKVYEIFKSVIDAEQVNIGKDYPGCIIQNENGDTIAENGLMGSFKYKGL